MAPSATSLIASTVDRMRACRAGMHGGGRAHRQRLLDCRILYTPISLMDLCVLQPMLDVARAHARINHLLPIQNIATSSKSLFYLA